MRQVVTRMFGLRRDLGARYSPLYFLAALGNGGMAVTFFIYLNFMLPHPKTPIITADGISAFLANAGNLSRGLVYLAMAGIIFFAAQHLRLVAWNLREFAQYRRTSAYAGLRETNSAVTLMGLPLTLAMTVNVLFVLGAIFVPGLWSIVEYLFPFSLAAFFATGALAMRTFLSTFGRMLAGGNFDCTRNNSLSQLQTPFTFSMIAVGLAAPAAMSENHITIAIAILGAIFFLGATVLIGLVHMVLGFRGMLAYGLHIESGPSLWMLIPILTLIGIALIRIQHGLHHAFEAHTEPAGNFMLTGTIVAVQLLVGLIGYTVLRQIGYFRAYLYGTGRSPASYGLICPGVALFVFGMFFIHLGLVQTGLLVKYSLPYYLAMAPFVMAQFAAIATMLRLDNKLLRPEPAPEPQADVAAHATDSVSLTSSAEPALEP